MNNNSIIDFVNTRCPKCGFSIFQECIDAIQNITCKKCSHSFDGRKKQYDELVQRFKKPFIFDDSKVIDSSRDVCVSGQFNDVSRGNGMSGSIHVGKISGDPFDNFVRDHNGHIQGKMTSSGHFTSQRV